MLDIRLMHRQGFSIREIARRTGHDSKTVRKYLRHPEAPRYSPRPPKPSKLDPYKEYLRGRMASGVFNANRLLMELRAMGYAGGKTILKDFVKPFRPPRKPVATLRFETRPGEQAQVDFGVFAFEDGGVRRRLYAFVMVLSYSRAMYVEFVEGQDLATLLRCHVHAFEALGGVPQKVLYDNLKPVVLGRDAHGQAVFHPRFLDFALLAGFQPQACRPYRAQTKGRVERAIGYLRQSFWPGMKFSTLEDLNHQAAAGVQGVANRRVHGTTGRVPVAMLLEEPLQPFSAARFAPFLLEERKVSRDGFVSWGGCRYGVPWTFAGRTVEVRERDGHVEILAAGVPVAVHPKAVLPGAIIPLPQQWAGLRLGGDHRRRDVVALRMPSPEVEVRPLAAYEALAEVGLR